MISPIYYTKDRSGNIGNFTLTAHRGAAGLAPENTISAVRAGLKYGADRIEIDVHQSSDDSLIVIHDNTLDRTTNGSGKIKDFTYSELMKYSAGIKYSEEYANEKIPTLDEVIKEINGDAILLIEVKHGGDIYPNIEKNIVKAIERNSAQQWCIIQSFNLDILKTINQINPDITIHKLNIAKLPFLNIWISKSVEFENILKYDFIDEVSIAYPFANKSVIRKVHAADKKINVWTINDKKRIGQLINLGIDGVITDYPNYFGEMKKEGLCTYFK